MLDPLRVDRRFYRIIKTETPLLIDFTSEDAKGRIPHRDDPETLRCWTGISTYSSLRRARQRARDYPWLGTHVAELDVSGHQDIIWERTTTSRGHYTLWGASASLLACVVAVYPVQWNGIAEDEDEYDDL